MVLNVDAEARCGSQILGHSTDNDICVPEAGHIFCFEFEVVACDDLVVKVAVAAEGFGADLGTVLGRDKVADAGGGSSVNDSGLGGKAE